MNFYESEYRKKPKNKVCLRNYVMELYKKQHILEAKYYHDKLIIEDPNGVESNRIGYLITIKMCNKNVKIFEDNLYKANASQEMIYALQLTYYHFFNDIKRKRDCVDGLLDIKPTEKYTCEIVLEVILDLKDVELALKLINNYHNITIKDYFSNSPTNRVKINIDENSELKKILKLVLNNFMEIDKKLFISILFPKGK